MWCETVFVFPFHGPGPLLHHILPAFQALKTRGPVAVEHGSLLQRHICGARTLQITGAVPHSKPKAFGIFRAKTKSYKSPTQYWSTFSLGFLQVPCSNRSLHILHKAPSVAGRRSAGLAAVRARISSSRAQVQGFRVGLSSIVESPSLGWDRFRLWQG